MCSSDLAFREREAILDLFEEITGDRLMYAYFRPGGLAWEVTDNFEARVAEVLKSARQGIKDMDGLLTENEVFRARTQNIGIISAADAIDWGCTGPVLRASGVPMDLRRTEPYLKYPEVEFDVVTGKVGDTYDRWLVRVEEMRQSVRILDQAVKRLPDGPVNVDDPRIILPPKHKATSEMESMIHHFKNVMEGPRPPIGEAYVAVESPKGEKGYYMVSDGTSKPARWRIRPPSYVNLSAIPKMVDRKSTRLNSSH